MTKNQRNSWLAPTPAYELAVVNAVESPNRPNRRVPQELCAWNACMQELGSEASSVQPFIGHLTRDRYLN